MRITNSAEGGTDETAVTVANSGGASGTAWDAVTIGTGATLVYDTGQAAHGTMSYRHATGATAAAVIHDWTAAIGGAGVARLYGRFYVRLTSITVLTRDLFRVRSATGTAVARIDVLINTGQLRLRNSPNTVVATSATVLAVNTWYRVEFDIRPGSSVLNTLRLYLGDSTTILETLSATSDYSTATNVGQFHLGNLFSQANVPTTWFDGVELNDTGWPGTLLQAVTPAGVAAADTVGAPEVTQPTTTQTVTADGVAAASAAGQPTVTAGPVTVATTGAGPAGAVGQPTVTAGPVTVAPAGVGSASTVGTPDLSANVAVAPAGVASTSEAGTPTLTTGPVTVAPVGAPSTSTVGEPTVAAAAVTITPHGVAAAGGAGAPLVGAGPVDVEVVGVGSASAVGVPDVGEQPAFGVVPHGVVSGGAVGQPAVAAGPTTVDMVGVASTSAVGQPTVDAPAPPGHDVEEAGGVTSTSAAGLPEITTGPVTVAPAGAATSSAAGEVAITTGPVGVLPDPVGSTSTVGSPTVTTTADLTVGGVTSTSTVGQPSVGVVGVIAPHGVTSTAAVGAPTVTTGAAVLSLVGVTSTSAVGAPAVRGFADPGRGATITATTWPTATTAAGRVGGQVTTSRPAARVTSALT